MIDLADMLAGVLDARLDGAACAGQHPLFDPRQPGEEHHEFAERAAYVTARFCDRCRVRDGCAEYAAELRPDRRLGIWAGVGYDHARGGQPI